MQLARLVRSAVPDGVAGVGDFAPAAVAYRARWPDNVDSLANVATAVLPADMLHCNNALVDETPETAVHSLSASNDARAGKVVPLAAHPRDDAMKMDPREVLLPAVKSRGQALTWLRGAL